MGRSALAISWASLSYDVAAGLEKSRVSLAKHARSSCPPVTHPKSCGKKPCLSPGRMSLIPGAVPRAPQARYLRYAQLSKQVCKRHLSIYIHIHPIYPSIHLPIRLLLGGMRAKTPWKSRPLLYHSVAHINNSGRFRVGKQTLIVPANEIIARLSKIK